MKAVFVGGSRRLSRLSEEVRRRLSAIMDGGLWVFVGDANGADRALQQFFAQRELMLWDGVSRGTLANIRNLLAHGKPVAVYLSPDRGFRDLKRETDLAKLLSSTPRHERPTKTGGGAPQRELTLRTRRRNKAV